MYSLWILCAQCSIRTYVHTYICLFIFMSFLYIWCTHIIQTVFKRKTVLWNGIYIPKMLFSWDYIPLMVALNTLLLILLVEVFFTSFVTLVLIFYCEIFVVISLYLIIALKCTYPCLDEWECYFKRNVWNELSSTKSYDESKKIIIMTSNKIFVIYSKCDAHIHTNMPIIMS